MSIIQARWRQTTYAPDGDMRPVDNWSEWVDVFEYEMIENPFPCRMQLRLKPEETDERADADTCTKQW